MSHGSHVVGSYITRMEPWCVLPDGGERFIPFRGDVIAWEKKYKALWAYRLRGVADFYPMVDTLNINNY